MPSVAPWTGAVILLAFLSIAGAAWAAQDQTNGGTTSSTVPRRPSCSALGAACGECGPAGQCLEHVGSGPPLRVCV